ncbi:MAG: tetratricopeptide repeat protein [Flavobacteriales bacterium]|nr:tetratricopeptide repeat protein [Flavobacteriales bacterium]MEB2341008.1 tetratricopeptide repeat protein [Flavobacteriia bacterium]
MSKARAFPVLLLAVLLTACGGVKAVGDGADTAGAAAPKDRRAEVMRLFMDATNARLQGDPGKAVQLYRGVLRLDPDNAATLFELAKLYHQGMHGEEALAMAKKAVAADKSNIWYRFLVADLSSQLGDLPGAAKAYQGILDQWPERYEVYFELADVQARQGKTDEAEKAYRRLEQQFGLSEELVAHEYDMLMQGGQGQKALELLQRARKQDPGNPQYLGMMAEAYASLGQMDKAQELYEQAVAADPDDSMARISLAQFFYNEGKLDEGFGQLKEAFSDPDLDIDPKMQLLLGFFQITDSDQADSTSRKLIEQSHALIQIMKKAHPRSGKPSALEGDFFMREGKPDEARTAFRAALEYEQDKYPIWGALVQLDLQLQDWKALHEDASKAASLFPAQPEMYLYDGVALGQLDRYDEAVETLLEGRNLVVDNKPLEAQFQSQLGDAYNELKEYAKSDEAYTKALAINKDDAGVLNNWAYYLSERGEKLDKAETMSRRSNELSPDNGTYMDTYAWILYKQGRYEEARQWQEKALKASPQDEGVLLEHYGDILYKLNDPAGAMEQWKKAKAAGGASGLIDRKISEGKLVE